MPIIANFLSGGNNSGATLGNVRNVQTVVASERVYIKWTDPDDLVVSGVTIGEWGGTLLVRKAGSAPTSRRDGTIIFDSKVRNAYASSYFVDSGLSNGVTYYYKLFPYTTGHSYTDSGENMFSLKPVSIAPGNVSNISASAGSGKIYLNWTDPNDVTVDGIVTSEWAGTKVVYRTDRYPTSVNDGTLAKNSVTKNAYKSTALTISGLTNGTTYYIGLFPYAVGGGTNTNTENRVSATPQYTVIQADFSRVATLVYNGNVQSPVWENYDTSIVSISGETYGTNAGTYRAIFTILSPDYCWSDGSVGAKTVEWTIDRKKISTVPSQSEALTYTGGQQTPTWKDYNEAELTLSGVTIGTNAGTYDAKFTPTSNYKWSDGTTTAKTVSWIIGKKSIASTPSQSGSLTYTGNDQSPSWSGYNSTELTLGGTTSGANAGSYTATFTPNSNYRWSDSSTTAKSVTWTIGKAAGTLSLSGTSVTLKNSATTATVTVSRSGNGAITAVSANTSIATVSVSGTTITISHVNKAHGSTTITVSVGAGDNYTAPSNQTIAVTANFPKITSVPSQSGTLTYSGSAQSPTWSNYNSAQLTLGGTTSGTNAGSYTVTFTPIGDYSWSDGSVSAKNVTWSIGKAAGSLSISPTSLTLDASNLTKTITVTRAGDGAITAVSSNTSVATVSVTNTTVSVSHVNQTSGTATITISVAAGTNHTAPSDQTCSVTAQFLPAVGTALNDMSWADIKKISDAGKAASYFSIGDRKAVQLSGTVGSVSLSGTYYCYIIGIDHNSSKEGTNRIHFQFGYSALSGGKNITFVDSNYGNQPSSGYWFSMNIPATNKNGWEGSLMRTVICPAFKNALPSDLQAVLKTVTKYSDNVGGGKNTATNVTATTDTIFLLAEYEIFGKWWGANSAEPSYQTQYAWYSAGNSKVKYKHSSTGTAVYWWMRSVVCDSTVSFLRVDESGVINNHYSNYSHGFSPAFCV